MRKEQKIMIVLTIVTALISMILFFPGLVISGSIDLLPGCSGQMRFCDKGDGTVLELSTGLVWLKNANCFDPMDWHKAKDAVTSLADGQCGLKDGSVAGDWRLPTKKEWEVFVDKHYTFRALSNAAGTGQWSEGDAFSNVRGAGYWSSTPLAGSTDYAWRM